MGVEMLCRTTTAPTKPHRLSGDTAVSGNITWAANSLRSSLKSDLHEVFILLLIFLLGTFPVPRDEAPGPCAAFTSLICNQPSTQWPVLTPLNL